MLKLKHGYIPNEIRQIRKIWPNGSYNMISVADTFKAIECGLKQEDCAYANKDIDSKTMLFIQQNADLVKSLVNK